MRTRLIAAFVVITLAALPLVAQELDSVQVHSGMINVEAFLSGERSLPLSELAFDEDVKSYTVRMPYGVDGVTLVVEASLIFEFGVVDFNGAATNAGGLGIRAISNQGRSDDVLKTALPRID